MEDLKIIIKRGIITSVVILIYGVITLNKYVYLGMFIGSILSIIGFYMIILDAKSSLLSNSPFVSSVIGYMKRYFLYGIFLALATKFYGFPMLLSCGIGLLNIKLNISIATLIKTLKNERR